MNKLRKIFEGRQNEALGSLKKTDGTIAKPGKETLETLVDTHFPGNTDTRESNYPEIKITKEEVKAAEIPWINYGLLTTAFNSFKSKKSPGTDKLKPIVFKHLNKEHLEFLLTLYKAMILTHFTPTTWKEAKLIFIPKPGKPSYNIPKAWRPISLTNYPVKDVVSLWCFGLGTGGSVG